MDVRGGGVVGGGVGDGVIGDGVGDVGDGLADILPTPFWSRLQGRFGTSRYWRDEGEDVAITNAVEAIAYCLQRDADGDVTGCTDPPSRQMIDAKL